MLCIAAFLSGTGERETLSSLLLLHCVHVLRALARTPAGAPNTTMHLTLPLSSDARSVALKVCEGESAVAAENSAIGLLHLTVEAPAVAASEGGAEGQTAAPASSVRVVFDLDADCVFTVRAEDAAHPEQADTGRVVIRNESGHLTKEEVERMAADHQVLWADARAAAGAGEEVA